MTETAPARGGMGCLDIGCFAAAALLWIVATPLIFSLGGSDAAGNGIASGFAVLAQILLWIPLILFVLLGAANSRLPGGIAVLAAIFAPVAAFASIAAVGMMERPGWIAVTPILLPPLATAFGFWMRPGAPLPARQLRRTAAGFGAATLLLLVPPAIDYAVWIAERPEREAEMLRYQAEAERAQAEAEAGRRARFAALGPYSPLEDFLEFTPQQDKEGRTALERLRGAPGRQRDAIRLLQDGRLQELTTLRDFDLAVTTELCTAYRDALARELVRYPPSDPNYRDIPRNLVGQLHDIEWLVDQGCDLSVPLRSLAALIRLVPPEWRVPEMDADVESLLSKQAPEPATDG